jgi:hypothetical protein
VGEVIVVAVFSEKILKISKALNPLSSYRVIPQLLFLGPVNPFSLKVIVAADTLLAKKTNTTVRKREI